MFLKEQKHKVSVAGITRKQIWQVWTDINNWHTWDHDIEWAKMTEPFAKGHQFTLKPRSGPKVLLKLFDVDHEKGFTDLAHFPLAKMYSIHKIENLTDDTLEITHVIRMEGLLTFLWWYLVGKNVAAGMSEQSQHMLERARNI